MFGKKKEEPKETKKTFMQDMAEAVKPVGDRHPEVNVYGYIALGAIVLGATWWFVRTAITSGIRHARM